jgi:hypothetical protein
MGDELAERKWSQSSQAFVRAATMKIHRIASCVLLLQFHHLHRKQTRERMGDVNRVSWLQGQKEEGSQAIFTMPELPQTRA